MKKLSVLFIAIMLMGGGAFAAEATTSSSSNGYWVIQVQGGIGIPASSNVSNYLDMGFGGEGIVSYAVDPNLMVGLLGGYHTFSVKGSSSVASASWSYIPIQAILHYNFGTDKVKPYGFLGAGLAMNTFSLTIPGLGSGSTSESDLLLSPGLGVGFGISDKASIVLEAKIDLDFTSGEMTYYIPIQAGVNFSLN
jgi:hypothetical protein